MILVLDLLSSYFDSGSSKTLESKVWAIKILFFCDVGRGADKSRSDRNFVFELTLTWF